MFVCVCCGRHCCLFALLHTLRRARIKNFLRFLLPVRANSFNFLFNCSCNQACRHAHSASPRLDAAPPYCFLCGINTLSKLLHQLCHCCRTGSRCFCCCCRFACRTIAVAYCVCVCVGLVVETGCYKFMWHALFNLQRIFMFATQYYRQNAPLSLSLAIPSTLPLLLTF